MASAILDDIKVGEVRDGVRYVTPAESYQLIEEHKDLVVLDVRTPKEFKESHIKDAINVNFFSLRFASHLKKLDPSKTYLVHCAVGGRSQKAIKPLQKAGIHNIIHMDHGFNRWLEEKLPHE